LMMLPVATAPAKAGVNIDVNILGGGKGRISCRRGERIVENAGWRRVEPRNCSGRNYSYSGRRGGDRWIIIVDSRRARIVDAYRR
jgi:hypothetical protein